MHPVATLYLRGLLCLSCLWVTGGCTAPLWIVAEICGNGVVDQGELCDDGNTASGDGCDATCTSDESCGNGVLDAGEACEDGNTDPGDGCSAACQAERCGNGELDPGEACDDGGTAAGDGCDPRCNLETCGNGALDPGESCDDGGTAAGDGCSASCVSESCGDGVIDPGEVCDDGGVAPGDGCDETCTSDETCGNRVVDEAETCDDGGVAPGDGCSPTCLAEFCGNGTLDPGEACDDGDTTGGDGCNATCSSDESCANGVLDVGEECEDGGIDPHDGCSATCTAEFCGNGVLDHPGEICDDGGESETCDTDCTPAVCSDLLVNTTAGEQCDDGNTEAEDGCDADCLTEALAVGGGGFRITAITTDNCQAIEHEPVTGDDRGGIAVSANSVFYTGDGQQCCDGGTGRFDLDDLNVSADLGVAILDALASDLGTGRIYVLASATGPINNDPGTIQVSPTVVTRLIEIDPATGAPVGELPLSQSFTVSGRCCDGLVQSAIFSGVGRIVVLATPDFGGSFNVFDIDLATGTVTDRGPSAALPRPGCETWATWGVAEAFDGALWLTYADGASPGDFPASQLLRHRVSDGFTEVAAAIPGDNMSDMCSFSVSLIRDRWVFHHEGFSTVRSGDETIGACDATFEFCGDTVITAALGESCDDGNSQDGDGCSADCRAECADGFTGSSCQILATGGAWRLVYDLVVPVDGQFSTIAQVPYVTDRGASLVGTPYTRVGYAVELDGEFVWTEMDDFASQDTTQLGLPVDWIFDGQVTNLTVVTNAPAVTPTLNSATGTIEFWSHCYETGLNGLYDFDDDPVVTAPDCHGSFQVHDGANTIWAYNAWAQGGTTSLGIGNQVGGSDQPDWTFANNAGSYTTRRILVYIQ